MGIRYYCLQYNWFRDFFGIYPFGQEIYPEIVGRYLDIRLCSIPTVGVYEKQGKLHLTRSTSYLLYYSSPKRAPSPLLLLRCFRPPPLPPAAASARRERCLPPVVVVIAAATAAFDSLRRCAPLWSSE